MCVSKRVCVCVCVFENVHVCIYMHARQMPLARTNADRKLMELSRDEKDEDASIVQQRHTSDISLDSRSTFHSTALCSHRGLRTYRRGPAVISMSQTVGRKEARKEEKERIVKKR